MVQEVSLPPKTAETSVAAGNGGGNGKGHDSEHGEEGGVGEFLPSLRLKSLAVACVCGGGGGGCKTLDPFLDIH